MKTVSTVSIKTDRYGFLVLGLRNHPSGFRLSVTEGVRMFFEMGKYADSYRSAQDGTRGDGSYCIYGLGHGSLNLIIRETLDGGERVVDEGGHFFSALYSTILGLMNASSSRIASVIERSGRFAQSPSYK